MLVYVLLQIVLMISPFHIQTNIHPLVDMKKLLCAQCILLRQALGKPCRLRCVCVLLVDLQCVRVEQCV